MKTKLGLLTTCAAFLFATIPLRADQVPSPDQRFSIATGSNIRLVDASGTVLVLDSDAFGVKDIGVSWSPDSRRVVVSESTKRGSSVLGAWYDGHAWHKTLEVEADLADVTRRAQALRGGRLVSESRSAGAWMDTGGVMIHGDMLFSSGAHAQYVYTLRFVGGPTHLDRGGYEEGAIKGSDFRIAGEHGRGQ